MAKALQKKGCRVRCFATGEVGNSLTFYKAPNGHYYKDQETYEQSLIKKPRIYHVRCCITGERGTSDVFYRGEDGRYYKDKATYDQYKANAAIYIRLMDDIRDIMAFDPSMAFPTVLTKTLKDLSQFYGYEIILETVERCKDSLEYAMRTKDFNSVYNRACYVMAVIKNNINDVYIEHKRKQEAAAYIQRQDSKLQETDDMNFADVGYAPTAKRDRSFFQDD